MQQRKIPTILETIIEIRTILLIMGAILAGGALIRLVMWVLG